MLNTLGISAQEEVRDNLAAPTDGVQIGADVELSSEANSQMFPDSLRASLITCTPGTDVYAHFGHTALRITNVTKQEDVVFNYGCFDMTGSNFVINFMRGETDYVVDAESANFFIYRYDMTGNGVSEQVLNLTQTECYRLAGLLFENIKPENRGYRYNWLYDNCTTRARDMIEKAIDGKVVYKNDVPALTARDELHESLTNNSWLKLGIDLMLGTEIDTIAPRNIQQFIPAHYENDLDNAYITNADGSSRKMVSDKVGILQERESNKAGDIFFTPIIAFSLLAAIAILISIYDFRRKKISYWVDILLHFVQGIAGIIITYLFFFSVHPAVSTNWQVILFNPLFLLYAVYLLYCLTKKRKDNLAYVISAVYLLFLLTAIAAGQSINIAVYIMVFILYIRIATRIVISKKQK